MNEIGLVPFARGALAVCREVVPPYSHRFSPRRFTQSQLLAILCLMGYEDWTFRAAEVRLAEHGELRRALELQAVPDYSTLFRFMLRLKEELLDEVLREVGRRLQRNRPAPGKQKSTVAVDATGLAPGSISMFFIRRREQHGGARMPWRYWLKWLLAVDTRLHIILAQKAHRGPVNDCARLRPLLDEVVQNISIGKVVADAEFDSERNHRHIREQALGNFTESVRRCGPLFQLRLIDIECMPKPYSALSNANSPRVRRADPLPHNANRPSCWDWPSIFTDFGHL